MNVTRRVPHNSAMRTAKLMFGLLASAVIAQPICASAAPLKPLYVDPACPEPGERITLRAAPDPSQQVYLGNLFPSFIVTRDGSTFTLRVTTVNNPYSAPQVSFPVEIGALAAGTYTVNFYTSMVLSPPIFAPEQFVASATFVVQENPPACEARHVIAGTYDLISAAVGQPYSTGFSVQVVDAHGLPVAGVPVHWQRIRPVGEPMPLAVPDPTVPPTQRPDLDSVGSGTTDAQGIVAFSANANGVAGTFQYRAYIDYAGIDPSAYFVVSNRPTTSGSPVYPVVEYYDDVLDHFFITMNPLEMAKLDEEGSGWTRTGGVFLAYGTDPATRPSNAMPVCRFYGLPQAGLDSHFFSASPDECDAVKQRFSAAWLLETDDAFGILLPDVQTGACPPGTLGVHRLYNNRPDANHRYAVGLLGLLFPSYRTQYGPWIAEGYGSNAVVMCSPE